MKTWQAVVVSLVGGIVVVAVSFLSGIIFLFTNGQTGEVTPRELVWALDCMLLTYFLCLVPVRGFLYRHHRVHGRWGSLVREIAMFFGIPMTVWYFYWTLPGYISWLTLGAVAALTVYQGLAVWLKR